VGPRAFLNATYEKKLLEHFERAPGNRIWKLFCRCQPKGCRRQGRLDKGGRSTFESCGRFVPQHETVIGPLRCFSVWQTAASVLWIWTSSHLFNYWKSDDRVKSLYIPVDILASDLQAHTLQLTRNLPNFVITHPFLHSISLVQTNVSWDTHSSFTNYIIYMYMTEGYNAPVILCKSHR